MRTFHNQRSKISIWNKLLLWGSLILLLICLLSANSLGISMFGLAFILAAIRAYTVYILAIYKVELRGRLLSLFRVGKRVPVVEISLGQHSFSKSGGTWSLAKNKGSDRFFLHKKHWQPELFELIKEGGEQTVHPGQEQNEVVEAVDTATGVLSLFLDMFRL